MKTLLITAWLLGAGGSLALASPVCTTMTAAQFQSLGNSGCQFGDKIYYNFTYSYSLQDSNGNNMPSNVPGSAVTVQFSNLGNVSYQPVVSFLSNWDVINGEQGDIRINYTVSATESMYGAWMTLAGGVSNIDPDNQFNAYISGAESICCPGPASSVVPLGVELDPPQTPSGLVSATGTDSARFNTATQLSFIKDIFLSAGSDSGVPGPPPNGNEAFLSRIDEGLLQGTPIPEPLSFLLFGSGLISMVLLTKRVGKLNRKAAGR